MEDQSQNEKVGMKHVLQEMKLSVPGPIERFHCVEFLVTLSFFPTNLLQISFPIE